MSKETQTSLPQKNKILGLNKCISNNPQSLPMSDFF